MKKQVDKKKVAPSSRLISICMLGVKQDTRMVKTDHPEHLSLRLSSVICCPVKMSIIDIS